MQKETNNAGPAMAAAGAMTVNMPAPNIAAKPVATASKRLSWGLRVESSFLPKNPNQ